MKKLFTLLLVALFAISSAKAYNGGYVTPADTASSGFPDANYFYGFTKFDENVNNNRWADSSTIVYIYVDPVSLNLAAGARGEGPETDNKFLWDITASENDGLFYLQNIVSGTRIVPGSGNSSAVATSELGGEFTFLDFSDATSRSTNIPFTSSGKPYASYMAFGLARAAGDRNLQAGTAWYGGLLKRNDCVTLFYGVKKTDAYQTLLQNAIAEADAITARTVTEGDANLNYPAGKQTAVNTTRTAAATAMAGSSWSAMETALKNLNVAIADFKTSFAFAEGKYNLLSGADYLKIEGNALVIAASMSDATIFDIIKEDDGLKISVGLEFLSIGDSLAATATIFEPVVDNGLVALVSGIDTIKVADNKFFGIAEVLIPLAPGLKSASVTNGAVSVDTANITLVFDQKFQLLDAAKITLNGAQASYVLQGEDTLVITNSLTVKTAYKLVIESGAIANKEDATLIAEAVEINFTTFSPYLRDKATFAASATEGYDPLTSGFTYALFAYNNNNKGVIANQLQIVVDENGALAVGMDNAAKSYWVLEEVDTKWTIKNSVSNKYLSWNETDSSVVFSDTPANWQFTATINSGDVNYMWNYVFWPDVTDASPLYDCVIRVDSTIHLGNVDALDTRAAMVNAGICPKRTVGLNVHNFSYASDYYLNLRGRNGGIVAVDAEGKWTTALGYGDMGAQWRVAKKENGTYTLQNRQTKTYITYVAGVDEAGPTAVLAAEGDNEFTPLYHCDKSPNVHYTFWINDRLLDNQGSLVAVDNANGDGSNSGSGARLYFLNSGVSYIVGEGAPAVTVTAATSSSIDLAWTENVEADRYIVRFTDDVVYANGDSIGYDSTAMAPIYEQIRQFRIIDTVDVATYKVNELATDVLCYFDVQAISATGLLGERSKLDSTQTVTLDKFKPAAPTIGEVTMKTIALSWLANSEADGYTITYWSKEDKSDVQVKNTAETSMILENILANTKVYMTLSVNSGGLTSQPSEAVSALTTPYTDVQMNVVSTRDVETNKMTLYWDAVVDAVSYNVFYTDVITGLPSVTPVTATDTFFVMENLEADKTYYIQVQAVDVAGVVSSKSGTKTQRTAKATSIDTPDETKVAVLGGASPLRVVNAMGKFISVYSITGNVVLNTVASSDQEFIELEKGVYLIKVGKETFKGIVNK